MSNGDTIDICMKEIHNGRGIDTIKAKSVVHSVVEVPATKGGRAFRKVLFTSIASKFAKYRLSKAQKKRSKAWHINLYRIPEAKICEMEITGQLENWLPRT